MKTLRAIKHFQIHELARLALRRVAHFDHCYLLHRRLQDLPSTAPRKIGGGELRRVEAAEIESLYEQLSGHTFADKCELLQRIHFYENGFKNCYAMDVDGETAYLQWIIYPAENEIIQSKYRRLIQPLRENEVVIDNAFTFPAYRGRGFMSYASWQLLQMAKSKGYRRGITYVRKASVNSLNVLMGIGFSATKLARDFKVLGYARRTF